MADIPESATIAVDPAYLIDFYLAKRRVIGITMYEIVLDVRDYSYDYAVLGRYSLTHYRDKMNDLEFLKAYGDKNDLFAEYAELYRRVPAPRNPANAASSGSGVTDD